MKKKATLIMVLGIALFAFTGCVTRTSGIYVEKGKLHIENPAFASNIQIIQDTREKTDEGFLLAHVTVKNLNHSDYRCQYCFEWLDMNGQVMTHAPTPWRPLVLHGMETYTINAVAPIQGADDFSLKMRRID